MLEPLKPSLLSHSRSLRLNALRLLTSPLVDVHEGTAEFLKKALQAEEVPIDVQGVRERVLRIGRLPLVVKDGDGIAAEICARWLIGTPDSFCVVSSQLTDGCSPAQGQPPPALVRCGHLSVDIIPDRDCQKDPQTGSIACGSGRIRDDPVLPSAGKCRLALCIFDGRPWVCCECSQGPNDFGTCSQTRWGEIYVPRVGMQYGESTCSHMQCRNCTIVNNVRLVWAVLPKELRSLTI